MALLPDSESVVSIDEIEDYFATRGAWTGKRFQLASTAAKRTAVRRLFWPHWLMSAGWTTLVVFALPPVSITLVLGVSLVASLFPAWFPGWVARISPWPDARATSMATPQLWFLLAPVVFWAAAFLLRRNFAHILVTHEAQDSERVVFLDPLVAGEVMGQPEVLVYAEVEGRERKPFCVPVLTIPEDLAPNREPDERHLVRGAAQCLLLERAYKLPVDLGVLEFRNRVVSFVMTDFARERTEAVLDEIRRLQADDN
jgi:hypothetical protein